MEALHIDSLKLSLLAVTLKLALTTYQARPASS